MENGSYRFHLELKLDQLQKFPGLVQADAAGPRCLAVAGSSARGGRIEELFFKAISLVS
jgi:hypothetical protein